jgi:hypothetical protein
MAGMGRLAAPPRNTARPTRIGQKKSVGEVGKTGSTKDVSAVNPTPFNSVFGYIFGDIFDGPFKVRVLL